MSKDNNPEAQVEQTTSQATENENMVTISAKELNDLQESNANLIAERETLTKQNEDLQAKLKSEQESNSRLRNYWRQEEEKVSALKKLINSIPISSYMTAKELVNAIVENI